ncbi:MAG: DUF4148 domain-containing protein [Comamonadaceae bacterium]|nr:DUF4148 domain-containing protein [Pseudomonadota bacterium]MBS0608403.1 DUF4148 domain-containing protein [Pseudomonadota bacterium]MDE2415493.1 DUF4148 domain-containing protein [Comamonadaceae bacterium]
MNKTMIAVAMALGSIAAAHADSAIQYGEGSYPSDSMQSQPSALTRAAVVGDLQAARANGTLPRASEGYEMPAPTGAMMSTLTRAEVRQQAREAAQYDVHAHLSSSLN